MKNSLYFYKINLLSNYDGDTLRADVKLGLNLSKNNTQIRLFGINCPESSGLDKVLAKEAKNYVNHTLTSAKSCYIRTLKDTTEKHGRLLGVIYYEPSDGTDLVNLNQELILKDLARPDLIKSVEDLQLLTDSLGGMY